MKTEEIGPSLLAAFARVPDVRSRHGRRSQLPALLTLATAAMLAGARRLYAIAQWGRLPPPEVCRALGFSEGSMPAVTTLHYAFRRRDTLGGAGGDGGGAGASQAGGGTRRGAAPLAAGALTVARAAGQGRCALLPEGAVPPDPRGGRGLPVRGQGPPARSARRRDLALPRTAAGRALRDGVHGRYTWRAAGGAAGAPPRQAGALPPPGGP